MSTEHPSIKHPTRLTTGDFTETTDPISLFFAWFEEAGRQEPADANAMALATVDADGRPNVRIVLMKEFTADGVVFFTNYGSRKSGDMTANPFAALNFHWKSLKRQVRIRGQIARIPEADSDAYFATRPRQSQIGAWASQQSRQLESRAAFEAATDAVARQYEGKEIPRPQHWGGYRLVPDTVEFWQDRPYRLHDRIEFRRSLEGNWTRTRLFP